MNAAPVSVLRPPAPVSGLRHDLAELARGHGLRRCYDCGKCTSVCPVGAPDAPFAGHRQLSEALAAAFAGERP